MAKATTGVIYEKNTKIKGVAAKTKTSKIKNSKLYKKQYRGQGR
jgi:hypothetical protein